MNRPLALVLGVALAFAAAPAIAAYDVFLKLDGVDGESTEDKHKTWVVVSSFTIPERGPVVAKVGSQSSGAGAGKVTFNPFLISRKVDKSSTRLLALAGSHNVIPHATLEFSNDNQHAVVWRAVLTDVVVTSRREVTSPAGAPATEEIVLAPQGVEMWSRPTLANGALGEWTKRDLEDAKRQLPQIFTRPAAPLAARP